MKPIIFTIRQIPTHMRCAGCGHDFFVAFSCRARGVCPSCTSKRSLLFGEKVREIVHPLNHRHVTFTIPLTAWLPASQPQTRQTAAAERMAGLA